VTVTTPGGTVEVNVPVPVTNLVTVTKQNRITTTTYTRTLLASLGGFKIAENESPMPQDRVFVTYNYLSDVQGSSRQFGLPQMNTQQFTANGLPATVTTLVPGVVPPNVNVNRELGGFEKSFLDGSVSFGVRVPAFQETPDGSLDHLGDITAIVKYAFYQDRQTGSAFCGGIAVTAPTGPSFTTSVGNINPVFIQPFVGYRAYMDRFFIQGFTSLAVPTDSSIATLLFNDIGIGYEVYRGEPTSPIRSLIPTFEVHVTTPLNDRQATAPVNVPDLVDVTGGIQIGMASRTTLTVGVVVPLTGPRPFAVEGLAQFNFGF
jgi:hypothetical protein